MHDNITSRVACGFYGKQNAFIISILYSYICTVIIIMHAEMVIWRMSTYIYLHM